MLTRPPAFDHIESTLLGTIMNADSQLDAEHHEVKILHFFSIVLNIVLICFHFKQKARCNFGSSEILCFHLRVFSLFSRQIIRLLKLDCCCVLVVVGKAKQTNSFIMYQTSIITIRSISADAIERRAAALLQQHLRLVGGGLARKTTSLLLLLQFEILRFLIL